MREEYFMNYDFLRKQGEKTDQKGRSFRMLDFEDGGMFFGVVEEELPAGLGAFVYADLKFHCGVYKEGLMSGLSRIHFGNGDVYDGMANNGQMEGEGYFFDCENNDWVFGHFEADNCVEVFEHGEAFPREEISKFRAGLHQMTSHYHSKTTDPLILDLDILLDYANRDISHLKPPSHPATPSRSFTAIDNTNTIEDEQSRKDKLHEFYKKALLSQETLKSSKEISSPSSYNMSKQKGKHKEKVYLTADAAIQSSTSHKQSTNRDKDRQRNRESTGMSGDETGERRNLPERMERGEHPILLESHKPLSSTRGDRSSLVLSDPRHQQNSKSSNRNKDRRKVQQNTLNQIVQDAHVVKPRQLWQFREEVTHTESKPVPDQQYHHSEHLSRQEVSHYSNGKEKDESRDLKNISIQTDDPVHDRLKDCQQEEISLSYLKGIHSMIDELKHMVTEKISSPTQFQKTGEVHFQPDSYSGQHLNFQYPGYKSSPFEDPTILSKLTDLRSVLSTPLLDIDHQTVEDWNQVIDKELEQKRQKEIEEALTQRFGPFQAVEVDERNIGEDVALLEPIKESVDDEEDEECLGRISVTNTNSIPTNSRVNTEQNNRKIIAGQTGLTVAYPSVSQLEDFVLLPGGIGENGESTIEVTQDFAKTAEDKFFTNTLEPRKGSEGGGGTRRVVSGVEKITEADQKEFYMGDPLFPKIELFPVPTQPSDSTLHRKNLISVKPEITPNFNQSPLSPQVQKITTTGQDSSLKSDKVIENKSVYLEVQGFLPHISAEDRKSGHSNFMYSQGGGESHNSTSRLVTVAPHPKTKILCQSSQAWLFFNPYLYQVSEEVDLDLHYN